MRYTTGLRKREGGLAVTRTVVCVTPAGVTDFRDIGLQGLQLPDGAAGCALP